MITVFSSSQWLGTEMEYFIWELFYEVFLELCFCSWIMKFGDVKPFGGLAVSRSPFRPNVEPNFGTNKAVVCPATICTNKHFGGENIFPVARLNDEVIKQVPVL